MSGTIGEGAARATVTMPHNVDTRGAAYLLYADRITLSGHADDVGHLRLVGGEAARDRRVSSAGVRTADPGRPKGCSQQHVAKQHLAKKHDDEERVRWKLERRAECRACGECG